MKTMLFIVLLLLTAIVVVCFISLLVLIFQRKRDWEEIHAFSGFVLMQCLVAGIVNFLYQVLY